MNECYMTVEEAKDVLSVVGVLPNHQLYANACREIIRLNEVIEGMRKESSTLVEQAESSQGGKWVMQSIPVWMSDNEATSVMTTTADSTMLYDQPPISFFRCPIHHCAIQNVRPGKWQCPECE